MLRRAGLVALLAAPAAFADKCYTCTNNLAITALDGVGDCYFTSVLPASAAQDCNGACFVKYTSEDGILTSVERGCITNTTTSTAGQTDIEFIDQTGGTFATDLTGVQTRCEVDTTAAGAVAHFDAATQTWTANDATQNRLTDLTCAKTCPVNGDTPCNGGNDFEVETLSDCGGKCDDATVCKCDHWTGVRTSLCTANTQRLVTDAVTGFFTCETYVCNPVCAGGAQCWGSGNDDSNDGQCRCPTIGTNLGPLLPNLYTGGQFLDSADDTCKAATCTDCACATCQCQHALYAATGSCACTGLGETYNAADGTCTAPVAENPKCQQCSSDLETGTTCATGSATATACANANDKCAAVSTIWVNSEGESIREVVERGCTQDAEAYDTCEFQTVSSTLSAAQSSDFDTALTTEVTCRYVCSGDNCNSELADGQDTTAEPTMTQCNVGTVCEGIDACKAVGAIDFATDVAANYADTACPNINGVAARCVAKMSYLEHMRYDGTIERAMNKLDYRCEAATDSYSEDVKVCETSNIGYQQSQFVAAAQTDKLSAVRGVITMHSCTTACSSNNCNNAWPGQPTCYTCDHAADLALDATLGNDHCYTDVSAAAACADYHNNACFVKQSGLDLTSNWAQKSMNPYSAMQSMGAMRAIERGCTTSSEAATVDGTMYSRDADQNQVAHVDRMVVCKEDGCNFGPALPTPDN